MPKYDNEAKNQIGTHCYACDNRQRVIVKHLNVTKDDPRIDLMPSKGAPVATKNRSSVCTNPQCHRYANLDLCPSWVPEMSL